MIRIDSTRGRKPGSLSGFADYDAFVRYARDRLRMQPDEMRALHDVLVKLQSLGEDPVQTLEACQRDMPAGDCLDMLRFMMLIDAMNLDDLKAMA
jgi:hypothetical protein